MTTTHPSTTPRRGYAQDERFGWFVALFFVCACSTPKPGGFTVEQPTGRLTVKAPDGRTLIDASGFQSGAGRSRIEFQFGSYRFTDAPTDWSSEPVSVTVESPGEGELKVVFKAKDASHNRLAIDLACPADEQFLGFGAQADGLNHRGHKVPFWTSEPGIGKAATDDPGELWMLEGARHASSFGVPTWLSNKGYLGVVESDARSVFDVCKANAQVFRIEVWANEFTLWLFDGADHAQRLERATGRVLGRPPRPPAMAFAPWNDAIYGPTTVREVAAKLRDAGIASSAIWTEDFRGGNDEPTGYRLEEDWYTDDGLYPDAGVLAAELHRQGFAWHAYFNTFVVEDADVYPALSAEKLLVGAPDGGENLFQGVTFKPTALLDLSNPAGVEAMKKALRAALDVGFDGWMADYGEWLPPDAVLHDGTDPLLAHNRYAADWVKLNREVLDERAAEGRPLTYFVRAGWLGSTRDSPVVWAGDQRTSFQRDDGLYTVIPMGLGLGLAGVSTYGSDIAGYQSATNPTSTKELFFRWTTLGALTPVMRTHHGLSARQNWNLFSDAETTEHFRRWAQFHIQLFPYLDGASVDAETKGLPLMRAMALGPDSSLFTVDDQWLLGPSLLVAPVVDQGLSQREVKLPDLGADWYRWPSGEAVRGTVTAEAAVGEIPIFLAPGAIVPRLPGRVQTLLPADPPIVDLDDVQSEREVWVAAGQGRFVERSGLTWVSDASGPGTAAPALQQGGAWSALTACADVAALDCLDGTQARVRGGAQVGCGATRLSVPDGLSRVSVSFFGCR